MYTLAKDSISTIILIYIRNASRNNITYISIIIISTFSKIINRNSIILILYLSLAKNISWNSIKQTSIVIMLTFSKCASRNSIMHISITTIFISSQNAIEYNFIYILIAISIIFNFSENISKNINKQ